MAKASGANYAKQLPIIVMVSIFSMSPLKGVAETEYQSHDSISSAVQVFVEAELGDQTTVEKTHLDRRLKLRRCDQSLQVFWPPGSRKSGSSSVGVSCDDVKPWKIYVQTKISVIRQVAVLNHSLRRGDRLKHSDVHFEGRDISRLNGRYLGDISRIIGHEAGYSINANAVLKPNMFRAPKLVKRGQSVIVLAGSSGFEVRVAGKALSDGAEGDQVRVRNTRSKKIVEGKVMPGGEIKVY